MYSGLYTIVVELLGAAPDPNAADHDCKLAQFFEQQIEAAIGCFPFMMPATKENIEALHAAVRFCSVPFTL